MMAFSEQSTQTATLEVNEDEPRPTDSEKELIIQSIRKYNLEEFKTLLLNTPNWHLITDKNGNNLLQITMIEYNYEAFNHILSFDCFPLEHKNKAGETALYSAMTEINDEKYGSVSVDQRFAVKLIKKGANIHPMALHHAVLYGSSKMARAVLERGVDPNFLSVEGTTPLYEAVVDTFERPFGFKMEAVLLAYGADPLLEVSSGSKQGYSILELILSSWLRHELKELTVLYVIDEHANLRMHLETLIKLAHRETRQMSSLVFPQIIDHVSEIVVDRFESNHVKMLQNMGESHVTEFRKKICFPLIYFILSHDRFKDFLPFTISTRISLHDINEFIQEEFGCDFSDFVSEVNSTKFVIYLVSMDLDESTATQILCYMLLHGLQCNQLALQWIYIKYGYNELFKMMLHMDFDMKFSLTPFRGGHFTFVFGAIPLFLYCIDLDLETFLEAPENYSEDNVHNLLNYFVHPELTRYCREHPEEGSRNKVEDVPRVPLLQQLARDTFRKYLIDRYNINSTRQFFSYVNLLDINNVFKKIITYESTLY